MLVAEDQEGLEGASQGLGLQGRRAVVELSEAVDQVGDQGAEGRRRGAGHGHGVLLGW